MSIQEIKDGIIAMHNRKQSDYGNSIGIVYEKYGNISILVRLNDKLLRLKNLSGKDKVFYEPVTDTKKDAYIYALMWKKIITDKSFDEIVGSIDETNADLSTNEEYIASLEGLLNTAHETINDNEATLKAIDNFINEVSILTAFGE